MLTPKQKAFLNFIAESTAQNGYAPTQAEICEHFGYSSFGTVQKFLKRLQSQGLLENTPNARRGLTVVPSETTSQPEILLPLLGRVAAGLPIEAIENEQTMGVPNSLVKRGKHFVLQVKGDSMVEEGILDGDFILVKSQKNAETGQTVVALIDNGATVKKYHPQKNSIELRPANSKYKPIRVTSDQSFQIEGIVVGLIRKLN